MGIIYGGDATVAGRSGSTKDNKMGDDKMENEKQETEEQTIKKLCLSGRERLKDMLPLGRCHFNAIRKADFISAGQKKKIYREHLKWAIAYCHGTFPAWNWNEDVLKEYAPELFTGAEEIFEKTFKQVHPQAFEEK